MEISSDPYEQKLYHMFKSHDTDCVGTLDETALIKLCNSLELNDQGNILINSMMKDNDSRVSFKAFKDALLNFLGTEMQEDKSLIISENDSSHVVPDSPGREVSPKLVVGTKKYGRRSRPQSLVLDSSQSESDNETVVVPNLSDKTHTVQRSSSQSEIQNNRKRRPGSGGTKLKRCASLPAQKNQKYRGSLSKQTETTISTKNQLNSSVESLGNLDFENLSHTLYEVWKNYGNELGTNYMNRHQLEIVCKRVGLCKVAGKVADEVFEKLNLNARDTISFNDFIGLIQNDADNGETIIIERSCNNMKNLTDDETNTTLMQDKLCGLKDNSTTDNDLRVKDYTAQLESVPTSEVIEMWETAGVNEARMLLSNLGFDDDEINLSHLLATLEEEIRGIHGNEVLKATLVLRKVEISSLQQVFRQLFEENKKLHADNKDANRRAAMLAQEIDERHANLEDKMKSEIRMLEQRHAEMVRELTSQLASDREHWSNLNGRLEKRIKFLEQEENRLKLELQTTQDENSALETEQISLQKQITDLLEANIKLNNEIVELEERQRNEDSNKGDRENEEVLELIDKITSLQIENANLRDKNDELVAEVEGLNMELNRLKNKKSSVIDNLSDDMEQTSLGVKRRGDSPSKTRIPEESPRLGKLRKCNNDDNESEASGEWVALNSEINSTMNSSATTPATTSGFSQDFSSISDGKDEEVEDLKEKICTLEKELEDIKNSSTTPKDIIKNGNSKMGPKTERDINENREVIDYVARCQELENSLEQMRKAYEDCEDYWQLKLSEERSIFEKERQIYEEEQQENDKKFTELMDKIREYEEQYDKEGRLSPIDEKGSLEQQYADLEAEMEEIKSSTEKMLTEKTKEIADLQEQIKELKTRLNENPNSNNSHLKVVTEVESSASSPISYLWNQSTIQAPARDYQNPNWNSKPKSDMSPSSEILKSDVLEELPPPAPSISPIQKPNSSIHKVQSTSDVEETASTGSNTSGRSFETYSIASAHSTHKSSLSEISHSSSSNAMKEELKKLKLFELQLKEQIKELIFKRDALVVEIQQLQEAKPILEKAYARAAHPTLMQRVNQLEQRNRHLQNVIRQQQQYTESLMHQSWQQQRQEIVELHTRLEAQGILLNDQAQRLTNADIIVKDMYLENSRLIATIQQLEQQQQHQRSRTTMKHPLDLP